MIVQPPKTIKDFEKIRQSILELMDNPYVNGSLYNTLTTKLIKVSDKIRKLKKEQIKY